jgi:hypothetical protein
VPGLYLTQYLYWLDQGFLGLHWVFKNEQDARAAVQRWARFPRHVLSRCSGCRGSHRRWVPM